MYHREAQDECSESRLCQPLIELREPALDLVDRQQVVVDDRQFRSVLPLDRADLPSMGLRPVLPSRTMQAAMKQQLAEPMARAVQVVPCIIARPAQIANRSAASADMNSCI